jgi:WD40 repeat protein
MTAVAEAVRTPYKGLSPFDDTELDALLFFGRERETQIVVANAFASRLTVLYGPSGVGKSSLLRAGVVHSMRKLTEMDPITVAYYSSWSGDPLGGIEEAARGALTETFGGDPGDAAGDLADRLDAWTAALGCDLCLVLDQFEELFLYHEEGGLLEALPEIVTRPGLRVNVVLGIRDDELAKLDIFKARIPGLFANYLRLDLLDRDAARGAILGPLDRYNELADEPIAIEPELVETVLGEVAAGRIDPGLVGRGTVSDAPEDLTRVETPYLQLVMQKLWEVERERRSPMLRLATLTEFGGAQRIVEDHLEHAMTALTPVQRDVAAGMFDHLVTPSGTKIAHGVADLASFARVQPSQIEPVLSSLARERILRPTGENGSAGDRYEIYHDVLAGAVLAWRAKHEAEKALVRERQESWRRQRRLAIVAGISLTAFALMAFLAAYAVSQRSTAQHQTEIALAEKASAQRFAQTANVARQREARGTAKYLHLSQVYRRTTAEQRRLKNDFKAQRDRLDLTNKALLSSGAQLTQSNLKLATQTQRANATAKVAQRQTKVAQTQTKVAKQKTAETLQANQQTEARALLSKAQAELLTDPVQAVKSALASTRTVQVDGAEDVLRYGLLATHVLAEVPAGGTATDAAYNFDASKLAVTSRSGDIRVFSVPDGRALATRQTGAPLNAVVWTPDGRNVATGGKNGFVELWDLDSKTVTRTFRHRAPVVSVAISPDGRTLATAGGNNVKLWDAGSGVLLKTLPHDRALRRVSFSNDGRLLLTVSNENAAHVWDVATGARVATLPQKGEVIAAAFSPDGTLVATASRDATAKIWNARSGVSTATMVGPANALNAIAFSPLGDKIVTASIDGTARIWNLDGVLTDVMRGFNTSVVSVAFSPDGQTEVGVDDSGMGIAFGAAQSPIHLLGQNGPGVRAVFAPNGLSIATVAGSTVRLWEPYGEARLRGIHKSADPATALAFDPTGKLLASGGADGDVLIQKAHGGPIRTRNIGAPVVALAWAGNGTLLMGAKDGTVHLSRDAAKNELPSLAHGSALVSAALRADGATVATAGTDGYIRIWNAATGERIAEMLAGSGLTSVALDPTGRLVAAGVGQNVAVYDARTGKQLGVLTGHTDAVTGLAYSPDGNLLASSSRDHDARVWDPHELRLVKLLRRHTAFVSGIAFSSDGRWLATAGPAKAGIWAARQSDLPGSFLQFVRGNTTPIANVAFAPHGWELATAARDGSVRVVDCKLCGGLPQLESYARARLASLQR